MPRLQPHFADQLDAAVLVRTAKGHGEKGFLLEPLSHHIDIDIVEETPDEVVLEELAVEQIDGDVHRLVATDPVIERDVFQLEIIPLLRGDAVGSPIDWSLQLF